MLFKTIPFDPYHLSCITAQPAQEGEIELLRGLDWDAYLSVGEAWTLTFDGGVLACSGLFPLWRGVAESWAMIDVATSGSRLLPVFRGIAGILDSRAFLTYHRIQTTVRDDFRAGHRMAKMLGMKKEGVMRQYSADGDDYALYARTS